VEVREESERGGDDSDKQGRRGEDKEWKGCIQKPVRKDLHEDGQQPRLQLKKRDSTVHVGANLAKGDAMCTDHDLHLALLPSNNDGPLFSRKRQQANTRFYVEARADGNRIHPASFVLDRAGFQGGFSSEFVVNLGRLAGPALGAAARAWLNGRAGRRIRLRIRETDVEAKDQEEFDRFLNQALTLAPVKTPSEHSHA
jgi:hypothetical protein